MHAEQWFFFSVKYVPGKQFSLKSMWYITKNTSKDYVESVLGIMGMLGPLSLQHKKPLITSA